MSGRVRCAWIRARAGDFCEGSLPEEEGRRLNDHLEHCEACQTFVQNVQKGYSILQEFCALPVSGEAVRTCVEGALAKWDSSSHPPGPRAPRPLLVCVVFLLLLMIAVAAAVFSLWPRKDSERPEQPKKAPHRERVIPISEIALSQPPIFSDPGIPMGFRRVFPERVVPPLFLPASDPFLDITEISGTYRKQTETIDLRLGIKNYGQSIRYHYVVSTSVEVITCHNSQSRDRCMGLSTSELSTTGMFVQIVMPGLDSDITIECFAEELGRPRPVLRHVYRMTLRITENGKNL